METKAHYTRVGFFVITGLMGIILFSLWLSQTSFTQQQTFYDIFFKGRVTGLKEGNAVEFRGVPIGIVKKILIKADNIDPIEVIVAIDSNIVIKQDAIASLETQGLTGLSYIQIEGSTKNSPPLTLLKGKDRLIIPSKSSLFEEVTDSLPQILGQLTGFIKEFRTFFNDTNQKEFSQILKNVQNMTEILTPTDAERKSFFLSIEKTLKSVDSTLIEIKKAGLDFQTILNDNRQNIHLFSSLSLPAFHKFLNEGQKTMSSLHKLTESIERSPKQFFFHDSSQGVPTH